MEDYALQYILTKEDLNTNNILIFKSKDLWYAYETSAFYCFSIFGPASIEFIQLDNWKKCIVRTKIDAPDKLLTSNSVRLVRMTDSEYVFDVKIICRGFSFWKTVMKTN